MLDGLADAETVKPLCVAPADIGLGMRRFAVVGDDTIPSTPVSSDREP